MNAPHAASDSGRTKTLALVGLGVVLLAFVASRFLLGGGGSSSSSSSSSTGSTGSSSGSSASPLTVAPAVPAAGGAAAGTPDATAGAAAAPAAPVETFEVFTTKNPFQPLRVKAAPAAATKPAAATAPAPAAVAPTPVAVAPAPVAVAPVASATTATGGQATEPVRTTRVALLDVFSEGGRVVANVRVNDTVSKVGAGDSFGTSFKVVSLDEAARCGRFLYGDDQFRMCRGEELLK